MAYRPNYRVHFVRLHAARAATREFAKLGQLTAWIEQQRDIRVILVERWNEDDEQYEPMDLAPLTVGALMERTTP